MNLQSIPKSFLTKLDGWRGKKAILRRGCHNWAVHIGDGGVFGDGWSKFVVENGVQEFDIIVFKHQGNMVFDFLVFDPSACERQYPNLPKEVEVSLPESDSLHTHGNLRICCCTLCFIKFYITYSCSLDMLIREVKDSQKAQEG
ncbi:putative transcription factor B3-Domain family [Helianthus annuus]|nr:putative transcription factor B3-Domain family [Helianthus annuus]KAJ0958979.1 putative transcription factor B3-Domain family [Helianthus annuus]